ncbi:hypothetical protein [Flavobacterium agrisoli]|uniref:Uncharacterized protein n=1 Tax=Flavobacterium agrisoli TaxID=2793066 RepID=A0A934PPN9_9FLAO|nr:hypothetical protein [Flavobacterium agrisoli]MBK0370624.1 hypothetical protein [Flavobacterium agrisoli]
MKEDKKEKFKNLKIAAIGSIFILFIVFYYDYYKKKQFDKYKETFKGETIALTTRITNGKGGLLRYYFYDSNKKILSGTRKRYPKFLNKFYRVKYDLKNPKSNYIELENELKPDSLTLVKAGFTYTKYYKYDDGVTSRYLEGFKWK